MEKQKSRATTVSCVSAQMMDSLQVGSRLGELARLSECQQG